MPGCSESLRRLNRRHRASAKKVPTAILVFDACRNNPFERSGTRAVGGGLAPMTQLPEGVLSVFSAGPRHARSSVEQ
jgi:hypothetical protein